MATKNSVCMIGHFAWKSNDMIGAVVKARSIFDQLLLEFEGSKKIACVDIYNWRKNKLIVLLKIVFAFIKNKNILLVISETSGPLVSLFRLLKLIRNTNILYCVVGGEIDNSLKKDPKRIKKLNCINHFFVETEQCVSSLARMGIKNVSILRNFKNISPIAEKKTYNNTVYKFCTFSRVTEEKGIPDAMDAISNLKLLGYPVELDIYGEINPKYKDSFFASLKVKNGCFYKGLVPYTSSVKTISNYFCLIFPTRFDGEGMPGTIVDAFAAGLPIICSDWKYRRELVKDGENGLVYPYCDETGLESKIMFAIDNPLLMDSIGANNLKKFDDYNPSTAIKALIEKIF